MKTHLIYTTVITLLLYPAYVQTAETLNHMADAFAEARIGISKVEAAEYLQVQETAPEHLKTPLPVKGGVK